MCLSAHVPCHLHSLYSVGPITNPQKYIQGESVDEDKADWTQEQGEMKQYLVIIQDVKFVNATSLPANPRGCT